MQRHRNNVGVLRLGLALLVIVAHSPEMVDGNRSRELLTRIFHTLSFGEVAVDGFFLISGYLITKSMLRTVSLRDFLERRVLRIFPAYIVAYLLSVYLTGPLLGAHPLAEGLRPLKRMLLLLPPDVSGAMRGMPLPFLNGSMWTISYEFRCYLLVALLGVTGVLRRRGMVAALTVGLFALYAYTLAAPAVAVLLSSLGNHHALFVTVGDPEAMIRFAFVFLVGGSVAVYWDELKPRINWRVAAGCAVLALACLYRNRFAELGFVLAGSITLFWLALLARIGQLQRINDSWDISYGTYLYAWPVANLLRFHFQGISPWTLTAWCMPLSLGLGAASWWGIERWSKDLVRTPALAATRSPADPERAREAGRLIA